MLKRTMFAAVAILAASLANADEERGFTFGIGLSTNRYDLSPSGLDTTDRATGWDVFGGYRFNSFVALEAAYMDGGSVSYTLAGGTLKVDGKAYDGTVVGSLPLGDSFALFGRAGFVRGDLKFRGSSPLGSLTAKDHDTAPIYGAGIRGTLDAAHMRLEYRRAEFDALDADSVTLSVAWLF